jgi:hypothetical protein
MQRRRWLQLGLASAVTLTTLGGAAVLWQPAMVHNRLSEAGRTVITALGAAFLEGNLPTSDAARVLAFNGLCVRTEALINALPRHSQAELTQLLSLLAHPAGRLGLMGLRQSWADAPVASVQQALQSMRTSSVSLRLQAYLALHDILGSAYFSDSSTWVQLGYPGPQEV